MDRFYAVKTYQNIFIARRSEVANFADIIKIAIILIKLTNRFNRNQKK